MVISAHPRWERIQRAPGAASYAGYGSDEEFFLAVQAGKMPPPFEHSGADAWDIMDIDAALDTIKASAIRPQPPRNTHPNTSKRSIWPGVRAAHSKGKLYWYWARVEKGSPWIRLPDPLTDPDEFMRRIQHLQYISLKTREQGCEGSLGSLVSRYRSSPKFIALSPRAQQTYNRYLDRLQGTYADVPLHKLTPEDVQVRIVDANATTPAAADMMLTLLRVLYAFASKRQRGLEDWTRGVEPYGNKTERQPWPGRVLEQALTSDDEPFRLAVTLALYTGQRPSDVCAMTWNAAQGGKIRVVQQKTRTPLEIEMHPALVRALSSAPRSDRHLFILSNRRGDPLTAGTFLKWCWIFTKAHDLKLGPHGLRKNATIELFEAGCSVAEVAAVTGHRSLAMLELYGKQRSQPKLATAGIGKWAATEK